MTINFDERIDRRHTQAISVDECRSAVFHEDAQTAKFPYPDDQVIRMWIADMDFAVAPAITEALHKKVDQSVFGYTFLSDEYYNAVINWMKTRHNFEVAKEEIVYALLSAIDISEYFIG